MKNTDKGDLFLEKRRQLLKLGAAGMPMVLTLRASASEAVISQLRCVVALPSNLKILVDDTGAAWVGNGSIGTGPGGGYDSADITSFKANADYTFPDGSAPSEYRPDACVVEDCEDGDGRGDILLSHLTDKQGNYSLTSGLDDYIAGSDYDDDDCHNQEDDEGGKKGKGKGNDEDEDDYDDDDDAHNQTDCGYTLYEYSNTVITPGNFVDESGNWTISGDEGLFIALSLAYADEYGNQGNWPGVSCLVSILNYVN